MDNQLDQPPFMRQEMRSYQPTWRERIAQFLMGDSQDQARRDLVGGLVGSTGLGNSGMSLLDLTPLGSAMSAQEALREGDDAGAAMYAGAAAAPMAGPALRGAMRAAPKTTAAVGGAMGALMSPADAGPRLTRDQQRAVELQRQRLEAQRKSEEEAQKARNASELERMQRQAEIERQRTIDDANMQRELEAQRARDAEEAAARAADKQQRMSFKERYPAFASALPFIGLGGALMAPAAVKAAKTMTNNRTVGAMEQAVERARDVLPTAGKPAALGTATEMKALADKAGKMSNDPGWVTTGVAAALPAEAALLPAEYDALMLPYDDPKREAAYSLLTDPGELAKRMGTGLMGGLPMAKLGGKLPAWPERSAAGPMAAAMGLEQQALAQSKVRAPAAKKAPARKKKPTAADEE